MFRVVRNRFRYLLALMWRFKVTWVLAFVLLGVCPLAFQQLYVSPAGERIPFALAFHHVYFLLMGQPTLEYVDHFLLEALNLLIPPLGILFLVDGGARFIFLFFAAHNQHREWIEVVCKGMKDHIVICGAGRVGFRVAMQLRELHRDLVVIERQEKSAFISVLRDLDIPVLIDDVRSNQAMERVNIKHAVAIVCATDDDLTNLNVALDARRLSPGIRVVIRLFDDDLVTNIRQSFKAEALSTSAVAAPALALSALDPRIVHSFHIGPQLMVVSPFTARLGLPGLSVGELRDRYQAITLSIRSASGEMTLCPGMSTMISSQDVLTLQCTYDEYRRLREFTHEVRVPAYHEH